MLKFILLYQILFSFIYSNNINKLDVDLTQGNWYHDYSGTQNFTINFTNSDIINYIKIYVEPKKNYFSPTLNFTSINNENVVTSQELSNRVDGSPAFIYIKKDQILNNINSLIVLCEDENWEYTLYMKDEGKDTVINGETINESYLVSKDNKNRKFNLNLSLEIGKYLIIGFEGSETAKLKIDYNNTQIHEIHQENFYKGQASIFPLDPRVIPEKDDFELNFEINEATEGDYIYVSSHIVNDSKAKDNSLFPDGRTIMGILNKNYNNITKECFPVSAFGTEQFKKTSKFFLTGRIYNKYALFWMNDEKGTKMDGTEHKISNGQLSYLIEPFGHTREFCFSFSSEPAVNQMSLIYSLELNEVTNRSIYNFSPQIIGLTYKRMIPKGSWGVFNGARIDETKAYTFYLYDRKGITEMYFGKCTNFTDCNFTTSDMTKIKKISKAGIYTSLKGEIKAKILDQIQNLSIIFCKDDDNEFNKYCEFDLTIYEEGGNINILGQDKYYKYTEENKIGTINFDFRSELKIKFLFIDIMIYSGDITFNVTSTINNTYKSDWLDLKEEVDIYHFKYFLANKLSVESNLANNFVDNVILEYKSHKNSFFSIQYNIELESSTQINQNITSGESFLVSIDPTKEDYKNIYISNYRYKNEKPFLVNFFSLNCDYKVTKYEEEIVFYDRYAQDIFLQDMKNYKSESYEYKIKITDTDNSKYYHKMCMLYVAGYETKDELYQTEILVSENTNQQVIFSKDFKSIRFLYPHVNPQNSISIYVNIIDQAYYQIQVFYSSNEDYIKSFYLTKSKIFTVASSDFSKCKSNSLCPIIVQIDYINSQHSTTENPMVEITIRQIVNIPSYISKNIAKKDYTCGDNYYYLYTDIGKYEEGEISINFWRDFGLVWGKVVQKYQDTNDGDDGGANWRGIYKLPNKDSSNIIPFDYYRKKLVVKPEDTKNCEEGCHLILGIQISQIGDNVPDDKFYPFTIITRIYTSYQSSNDIPKIIIQVNEYIIGTVRPSKYKKITQFYEFWIPHNSTGLNFDWQSDVAGIYINVGNEKPTIDKSDFTLLPSLKNSIFTLNNDDIIIIARKKGIIDKDSDNLENINFVIGIWTNKTDFAEEEIFSLRIFQTNKKSDFEITEVNTDQKVMCKPTLNVTTKLYQCLFMIIYDEQDVNLQMPLLIHAESTNLSATTYMLGNFIDNNIYDKFNQEQLSKKIPSEGNYDLVNNSGNKYLYHKLNEKNKNQYLFLKVSSDKEEEIMLLTSMPMFDDKNSLKFYPNPTTEQILYIPYKPRREPQLTLIFFSYSNITINLLRLGGEVKVNWNNDNETIYYLSEKSSRLYLSTDIKESSTDIINSITNSTNTTIPTNLTYLTISNISNNDINIFIISYRERICEYNFNEIKYGENVEIGYQRADLPIHLYSKIGKLNGDLSISLFSHSQLKPDCPYPNYPNPIIISGWIMTANIFYRIRKDVDISLPKYKTYFGAFDYALRAAEIYIPKSDYVDLKLDENNEYIFYYSMSTNNSEYPFSKKDLDLETQINKINNDIFTSEGIYIHGTYKRIDNSSINYKLRTNNKFLIVEISFNNEILDFCINKKICKENDSYTTREEFGKKIITINTTNLNQSHIYLCIFQKENSRNIYDISKNYIFKYINVENKDKYNYYNITDPKLNVTESDDILTCTFRRIEDKENNITYYMRLFSSFIEGENINTISLINSPNIVYYPQNLTEENETITIKLNNLSYKSYKGIQIIASIQNKKQVNYLSYIPHIENETTRNSEEKSFRILNYENTKKINSYTTTNNNKNNNNNKYIALFLTTIVVISGVIFYSISFRRIKNKKYIEGVNSYELLENKSD